MIAQKRQKKRTSKDHLAILRTHRTQLSTQGGLHGPRTEGLCFTGKEGSAPHSSCTKRLRPLGHLEMVVPTGTPTHVWSGGGGQARTRTKGKAGTCFMEREHKYAEHAEPPKVIKPSPRLLQAVAILIRPVALQGFTSYNTLLP